VLYSDRATALDLTSDSWKWIRGTRSSPPAVTTADPERRAVYVSALEQAEQLFHAAEDTGPASRPITIFYGLSQAGRAIAAAANSVTTPDGWTMKGHGISQPGETLTDPLPTVRITTGRPGDTGSFVRLSEILDSPLWRGDALKFGDLWDSIPENRDEPLTKPTQARRTPLGIDDRPLLSTDMSSLAGVAVEDLPPWVVNASSPEPLRRYLRAFPGTDGYSHPRLDYDLESTPAFQAHRDGWGSLQMYWKVPGGGSDHDLAARLAVLKTRAQAYGSDWYFFPRLGKNSTSLHPLMTWWAALHTLSMLARYQPAQWTRHIDVDRSSYAVCIEAFLETALGTVPRLIAYTLDEVCDGELTGR
jgi:hypothetical protein